MITNIVINNNVKKIIIAVLNKVKKFYIFFRSLE